jgi:hypothetical protein
MNKPEKITICQHQSVNPLQLCMVCEAINDTIDEYEAYIKSTNNEYGDGYDNTSISSYI